MLGLCLVIFAAVSCTYDYFEDENNFKIYIPQLQDGTIDNVLVSIHDASGTHRYTRFIEGPFDPNTIGRDGILRFKLPWGGGYKVSAFANVDETYCDRGQPHQDSHISEPLLGNARDGTHSRPQLPCRTSGRYHVLPAGASDGRQTRYGQLGKRQRLQGQRSVRVQRTPARRSANRYTIYGRRHAHGLRRLLPPSGGRIRAELARGKLLREPISRQVSTDCP